RTTIPPCFNAAQTCSSLARVRPADSAGKNAKQRSKRVIRLFALVSIWVAKMLLVQDSQDDYHDFGSLDLVQLFGPWRRY
ncbi:MAG: hypothetical protein KGL62_13230, partial [Bradyrhizobium sp.]|uniref:hypothetical protein n=1 Tax=Bradyrhizobium sp. TaxID=376 RepID=UPI0023950CC8